MRSEDQLDMSGDKSAIPSYEKGHVRDESTAEVGNGDIETAEPTKRGLKARHALMIALGGTIGS